MYLLLVSPEHYVYQEDEYIVKRKVNSPDEVARLPREGVSNVKVDSITGSILYILDGRKIVSEPADMDTNLGTYLKSSIYFIHFQ
jgi:hypothetical protein